MKPQWLLASLFSLTAATHLFAADLMPASQTPPAGIPVEQAPMFVSIGFDDNAYSGYPGSNADGGMTWATDFFRNLKNPAGIGNPATFDDSPVRSHFFFTSTYGATQHSESPIFVRKAWNVAYVDGHGVGNHTDNHPDGQNFTTEQWDGQISTCENLLTKAFDENEIITKNGNGGIGIAKEDLTGFRSPRLHYNNNLFNLLKTKGYNFDCSIEEGWQTDQDGTNFVWPYTLDQGSPGHDYLQSVGFKGFDLNNHAGLWEMPVHVFILPPDELCAEYGLSYSLRDKMASRPQQGQFDFKFDPATGKIQGMDYTLFYEFNMTKEEALATLKYTLDLRLAGNRAPFLMVAHTDEYSEKYAYPINTTYKQRQEVIESFVTYALSKQEVRFVPYDNVIEWMRNPAPLNDPNCVIKRKVTPIVTEHEIPSNEPCTVPAYESGRSYTGGNQVSYNGDVWEAQWWVNQAPGTSNAWLNLGVCGGGSTFETFGTITPNVPVYVEEGGSQSFTFTPETGYAVTAVLVNGQNKPISNPFTLTNITANTTIEVTFGESTTPITYYDITATAGANGAIKPFGSVTVAEGTPQTFTFHPVDGYIVEDVIVDNVSKGARAEYTFPDVREGHTINVTFVENPVVTFNVTPSVVGNGSVSPATVVPVEEGKNTSFTFNADQGYQFDSVLVDGVKKETTSPFTTPAVTADMNVVGYFSQAPVVTHTITATVDGAGSISPAGSVPVTHGEPQEFAIAADPGYKIDSVVTSGGDQGKVASYTFPSVTADDFITAYFSVVNTGDEYCADYSAWDANLNWVYYNNGEIRSHNNKLYECVNKNFSYYEPGSQYGYLAWTEVGDCM